MITVGLFHSEDLWYIDVHGNETVAILRGTWLHTFHDSGFLNIWANKDTYERLSLVGVPVDKKRRDRFSALFYCLVPAFWPDRYRWGTAVRVDLKDRTRKGFQRAKDACMRWDAQRQESGLLSWDVLMPIEKGWLLSQFERKLTRTDNYA